MEYTDAVSVLAQVLSGISTPVLCVGMRNDHRQSGKLSFFGCGNLVVADLFIHADSQIGRKRHFAARFQSLPTIHLSK
jgi:hypothetical protein